MQSITSHPIVFLVASPNEVPGRREIQTPIYAGPNSTALSRAALRAYRMTDRNGKPRFRSMKVLAPHQGENLSINRAESNGAPLPPLPSYSFEKLKAALDRVVECEAGLVSLSVDADALQSELHERKAARQVILENKEAPLEDLAKEVAVLSGVIRILEARLEKAQQDLLDRHTREIEAGQAIRELDGITVDIARNLEAALHLERATALLRLVQSWDPDVTAEDLGVRLLTGCPLAEGYPPCWTFLGDKEDRAHDKIADVQRRARALLDILGEDWLFEGPALKAWAEYRSTLP